LRKADWSLVKRQLSPQYNLIKSKQGLEAPPGCSLIRIQIRIWGGKLSGSVLGKSLPGGSLPEHNSPMSGTCLD